MSVAINAYALVFLLASTVLAQDARWADMPDVRFEARPAAPEPEPPVPPPPPALPPFYTRQTVRPDTPELLLDYINDPSDAKGLAYIAWEDARKEALISRTTRLSQLWQVWKQHTRPKEPQP